VSSVKYELGSYIPEDDILHRHCRGNLKSHRLGVSPGSWRGHTQGQSQQVHSVFNTYESAMGARCQARIRTPHFGVRDRPAAQSAAR
jgi:hypothetical protein